MQAAIKDISSELWDGEAEGLCEPLWQNKPAWTN